MRPALLATTGEKAPILTRSAIQETTRLPARLALGAFRVPAQAVRTREGKEHARRIHAAMFDLIDKAHPSAAITIIELDESSTAAQHKRGLRVLQSIVEGLAVGARNALGREIFQSGILITKPSQWQVTRYRIKELVDSRASAGPVDPIALHADNLHKISLRELFDSADL